MVYEIYYFYDFYSRSVNFSNVISKFVFFLQFNPCCKINIELFMKKNAREEYEIIYETVFERNSIK